MASNRNLLVLPGDGIGPEVMNEVRKIIAWMGKKRAVGFDIKEDVVGGAALDKRGVPLADDTMKLALEADAVLFGSVGGPKWDTADFSKKPERGSCGCARKWTCSPTCARPRCSTRWSTQARSSPRSSRVSTS